jgi:hypothetical protein
LGVDAAEEDRAFHDQLHIPSMNLVGEGAVKVDEPLIIVGGAIGFVEGTIQQREADADRHGPRAEALEAGQLQFGALESVRIKELAPAVAVGHQQLRTELNVGAMPVPTAVDPGVEGRDLTLQHRVQVSVFGGDVRGVLSWSGRGDQQNKNKSHYSGLHLNPPSHSRESFRSRRKREDALLSEIHLPSYARLGDAPAAPARCRIGLGDSENGATDFLQQREQALRRVAAIVRVRSVL